MNAKFTRANVANTNVIIAQKLRPIEAILKGNIKGWAIARNGFFNRLLIEGNVSDIPNEILNTRPWYTGTAFAYGNRLMALGKSIEMKFGYEGEEKVLIYRVRKKDIGSRNLMFLFEHGFRNGVPLIQLFNAKTEKQIVTMDGLGEAEEVIIKVIGRTRSFDLTGSDATNFEKVGDRTTRILSWEHPKIGLLKRGDEEIGNFCSDAAAGGNTYRELSVLFIEGKQPNYTAPRTKIKG